MTMDLRLTLWIALAMLAGAEVLGLAGIIPLPHHRYASVLGSPHAVFALGALAETFCVLYLFSRPPWREALAVLAGSVALFGAYFLLRPQDWARSLDDLQDLYAGALAVTALAALAMRARSASPPQRLLIVTL